MKNLLISTLCSLLALPAWSATAMAEEQIPAAPAINLPAHPFQTDDWPQ